MKIKLKISPPTMKSDGMKVNELQVPVSDLMSDGLKIEHCKEHAHGTNNSDGSNLQSNLRNQKDHRKMKTNHMLLATVRASPSDFGGPLPTPRSGHTAVNVGKSKIIVFGGLVDKNFLDDISVYDIDNKLWFQPQCTGSGSDGQMGPSPRAFHIAIAIDCHMFVFSGRLGTKRLGDFWVLDTDIWQWSELTSFGDSSIRSSNSRSF